MFDRSQISIWSILKQFIGKELSKIAMPAALCEPLSFLQRISENVYYSDLLHKAAHATNPCKRMEYVAAYAVTNISSNIDRLSKPFNPLLGETYELVRDDLGFRIVCEQVSHHPPVSAFHCDSTRSNNEWKFYGCVNPKIKFWGKSIEVTPKGTLTLELNK
jgi:oxysterol-binding protein-related protein 1/2